MPKTRKIFLTQREIRETVFSPTSDLSMYERLVLFLLVSFADVDTGFAVGATGTVLKTIDGGSNWIELQGGFGRWLNVRWHSEE